MYEYTQNYYDGGYRYPNPPWPIAGSPQELNVEVEDSSYLDMNQSEETEPTESYLDMNRHFIA